MLQLFLIPRTYVFFFFFQVNQAIAQRVLLALPAVIPTHLLSTLTLNADIYHALGRCFLLSG